MHFKGLIGDFFQRYVPLNQYDKKGIILLKTPDPMTLNMVKNRFQKACELKILMGPEVELDWLRNEIEGLFLLEEKKNYFIHLAKDLKSDVVDYLCDVKIEDRFLFLSYEKEDPSFKKILNSSEQHIHSIILEEPPFWQYDKVIHFLSDFFNVTLTSSAKDLMLQFLENNFLSFYHAFEMISLNHEGESSVGEDQLIKWLTPDKMDYFHLADLYLQRKYGEFFQKILVFKGDFEKARGLFFFMQTHLIKVLDPRYTHKKKKLSRYDQNILRVSHTWKKESLFYSLEKFNNWEMKAKKKDPSLWVDLKEIYLNISITT